MPGTLAPPLTFGLLPVIGLGELLYPIEEEGYSDCVSCLALVLCVKKVKCEKLCVLISICSRSCQSRRVSIGYFSCVQLLLFIFLQLYLHIKTCICTARFFAEMHN